MPGPIDAEQQAAPRAARDQLGLIAVAEQARRADHRRHGEAAEPRIGGQRIGEAGLLGAQLRAVGHADEAQLAQSGKCGHASGRSAGARVRPRGRSVHGEQPTSVLFTAWHEVVDGDAAVAVGVGGWACDSGALPSAMLTVVMSSSIVTMPLPLQSPAHPPTWSASAVLPSEVGVTVGVPGVPACGCASPCACG